MVGGRFGHLGEEYSMNIPPPSSYKKRTFPLSQQQHSKGKAPLELHSKGYALVAS
jgi:hypothetical protein